MGMRRAIRAGRRSRPDAPLYHAASRACHNNRKAVIIWGCAGRYAPDDAPAPMRHYAMPLRGHGIITAKAVKKRKGYPALKWFGMAG